VTAIPLENRLVEVIADRGEATPKRYRYGSGCRVVGKNVLTAAHVVQGASSFWVRGTNKRKLAAKVLLLGDSTTVDLALLEITDPTENIPPVPLARVNRGASGATSIERCHAIGYPAFMEVPAEQGSVRETLDAPGVIPVFSNLVRGLISVVVSNAPRDLPPEQVALGDTQWSGMSGAPVVAGAYLLGAVSEHAPRAGKNALTATPLTRLDPDPEHGWAGVAGPEQWWDALGVGSSSLELLPPEQPEPLPPYRETVRDLQSRTGLLVGRQRELTQIVEFATGLEPYRRIVGDAWAGKSALMAEAALTMPSEVDVVSYFLSRRAADADANKFLASVVPQLALLVDPSTPAPSVDRDSFLALWARALDAAQARGRHLLLIVDGLDEDLHPSGSSTVASLLPVVKEASGGHVLFTNRGSTDPGPTPSWLSGASASLLDASVETLLPTAETEALQRLAQEEVEQLQESGEPDLAYGILGTMAAAAGPLALDDLETLLPNLSRDRISRFLATDAARTIRPRSVAGERAYEFSHDTLLQASRDGDLADRLNVPQRRRAVHKWAATWEERAWLADPDTGRSVPGYLLDAYPSTFSKESDLTTDRGPTSRERLKSLLSDVGWVDAAVVRLGVDRVLAILRSAAHGSTLERVLVLHAPRLRWRSDPIAPGLTATQMTLGALELREDDIAVREDDIAERAGAWLRRLPGNHLIPRWTTKRQIPHVIGDLGEFDIRGLAVTSEGKVIVGGNGVRLWDPSAPYELGREIGRHESSLSGWVMNDEGKMIQGGSGQVWAVAVTGEGNVVSGGDDGVVRLWDPGVPSDPGRELGRHAGPVCAVAVTGDGKVVSGGDEDRAVRLWDPAVPNDHGREIGRHKYGVCAVAVTGDGKVVSGGDDGVVSLWDPSLPNDVGRELGRHADEATVCAVVVTGDGKVVSGGDVDFAVRLWDPAVPNDPGREIGRHRYGVFAVAVTGDGKVVSGGGDDMVSLWDPSTQDDPGRELGRNEEAVYAVAVTGEGKVVSGGYDGVVRLWDPNVPNDPGANQTAVSALAVSSDGTVVTGGYDGVLRLWDPTAPDGPGRELGYQRGPLPAVAVTSEAKVVTGGYDGVVRLWDPNAPGEPGRELGRHKGPVSSVAVTGEGKVVSGGGEVGVIGWADGVVRLWDPSVPDDPGRELGIHEDGVYAVAVTGEGKVVTGGCDGVVRLWDPNASSDHGRELGRHDEGVWVCAVAVTEEGKVVSGGNDGVVSLWDPSLPNDVGRELGRHESGVSELMVTAEGKVISVGDEGVRLWDPNVPNDVGRELARLKDELRRVAAERLGTFAIGSFDDGLTVFELTSS
jgi:WD40 repeat protein